MDTEVNIHVINTLKRIRQIITDTLRSYQTTKHIDCQFLNEANVNLRRISSRISTDTFNELTNSLNALKLLQREEHQQEQHGFTAPRINSSGSY